MSNARKLADGIKSSADATAITITSSERVGIGTTEPDAPLHAQGPSGSQFVVEATSGQFAQQDFKIGGVQKAALWVDENADLYNQYVPSGWGQRLYSNGTEKVRLWPAGQVFFKNGVALHPLTIVNLTTSYQNIIDISSGGMTNSYGGFIAFSGENNYHQGWVITHSGNGFSAHYFGQSSGHTHSLDVQWQKSGSYIQAKKSYSTGRTISVFLAMGNSAGLYDF